MFSRFTNQSLFSRFRNESLFSTFRNQSLFSSFRHFRHLELTNSNSNECVAFNFSVLGVASVFLFLSLSSMMTDQTCQMTSHVLSATSENSHRMGWPLCEGFRGSQNNLEKKAACLRCGPCLIQASPGMP